MSEEEERRKEEEYGIFYECLVCGDVISWEELRELMSCRRGHILLRKRRAPIMKKVKAI